MEVDYKMLQTVYVAGFVKALCYPKIFTPQEGMEFVIRYCEKAGTKITGSMMIDLERNAEKIIDEMIKEVKEQ